MMVEAGIAVAILAGAVLVFAGAVILGLALGRRLDRLLVAGAARDDVDGGEEAADAEHKEGPGER